MFVANDISPLDLRVCMDMVFYNNQLGFQRHTSFSDILVIPLSTVVVYDRDGRMIKEMHIAGKLLSERTKSAPCLSPKSQNRRIEYTRLIGDIQHAHYSSYILVSRS